MLRENPAADLPGCYPADQERMIAVLTTSGHETRPLNQVISCQIEFQLIKLIRPHCRMYRIVLLHAQPELRILWRLDPYPLILIVRRCY